MAAGAASAVNAVDLERIREQRGGEVGSDCGRYSQVRYYQV